MSSSMVQELTALRQKVEEKDRELEKKDQQLSKMTLLAKQQPQREVYHILKPTLAGVQAVYDKTSTLPVLRHFVRFGLAVADVGMRRVTPFGSCAGLNEQVGRLAPYLDEQVISPQIQAWRTAVVAICGPAVTTASARADPYIVAVRPYVKRLVGVASPITNRIVRIGRPIAVKVIATLKPQIERLEEVVEEVAEKLDQQVEDAVENLDAEEIFAECQHEAEAITQFAKAHSGEAVQAIAQASAAIHEVVDATAGSPKAQ